MTEVPPEETPDVAKLPREGPFVDVPLWLQIVWCVFAFAGLAFHAYEPPARFPLAPITDVVTLGWGVFLLLGLAVNYLSEIGLPGGGKLAFRNQIAIEEKFSSSRVSIQQLAEVVTAYADQLQSWTQSINLLSEQLAKYGTTDDAKDEIVARFSLERMEEAKGLIGEDDDTLRVSLWWYSPEVGGLMLIYSDDIRDEATLTHVFYPRQGLCGQCFVEDRVYNLADASTSIYFEAIAGEPNYHGLLLVPVHLGTGPALGVLSVDRTVAEQFDAKAENVIRALADLLAYANCHPLGNAVFPASGPSE